MAEGRSGASTPVQRLLDALDRSFPCWSLAPAVALLFALTLYPLANLAAMSLSTISFAEGRDVWTFTPARNFSLLFSDEVLRAALSNTLIFVVASTLVEVTLGLALAIGVSRLASGKGMARTLMILPIIVPPVAIGSMWKLMYNYDFGLFNQVAAAFGADPINWLGSPRLALASVILVDVWHWTPFVFLILFAAVEALPVDVLEAAHVDGASRSQSLRHVMLPMLRPALAVAVVFRGILAFKAFDEIYLLTSGGPGTATEIISLHLNRVFFEQNQLGYGALLALLVIAAIVGLLALGRRHLPQTAAA
ncbi:MAG: carbohydrate ABC transporter permease [Hyphomicrobiales bacterium]